MHKLSGFNKSSQVNEEAFNKAVDKTAAITRKLFASITTHAAPRNREIEAALAHERAIKRFGT